MPRRLTRDGPAYLEYLILSKDSWFSLYFLCTTAYTQLLKVHLARHYSVRVNMHQYYALPSKVTPTLTSKRLIDKLNQSIA